MAGPFDLTGQNIENTYQRILQTPDGVNVYDGTGSAFTVTAVINTSSLVTTSSFNAFTSSINTFTSSYNTGSFSGSFSGSFYGTASWAQSASQAISSSYALTASYALNGGVTSINIAGTGLSINQTTGAVIITGTGGGGGNTATGSYGSFYSTVTQTNVASTARSMSLNTTDISNGVSISGSTNPFNTYIKTENPGVYDIQFSAQVDKTDSGTDEIWIWLRKNGVNVTDSATSIQLVGNGAHYVAAWNFFVNAAANDYFQLMWYSPDANVRLHAEAGFGVVPSIPSLIVTVNRVDQFLSNTGSFSGSFTGVFTGSLFGTASWATNAQTSSNGFPYTGSAGITGSLIVSGGFIVRNSTNGNKAIDSDLSNLYYSDGDISVGWADSQLRDTNNDVSINWNERTLFADDNETTHINWSNPSYMNFPSVNTNVPIVNVLGLDINGNLYATASTAFGGGGGPSTFKSTSSFLGNGLSSSFNINHGFNTRNLHITVYDSASGNIVYPDLKHINANTSSIIFANPPSSSQYVVYISQ